MPKQTYQPTEADRATGQNVRRLRRLAGETLQQTIDWSGIGISQSSLSKVELGERRLTLPEATKLAAHFGTTAERIICKTWPAPAETTPPTEQEWLGNEPTELFAVPDSIEVDEPRESAHTRPPLSPEQYREQVWIPYLEQRYAAELKQTG